MEVIAAVAPGVPNEAADHPCKLLGVMVMIWAEAAVAQRSAIAARDEEKTWRVIVGSVVEKGLWVTN